MNQNKVKLAALLCASIVWSSAAAAGPPVHTGDAQLVSNLRARREGNKVHLSWTQPLQVSDQQSIVTRLVSARVCRFISSATSTASKTQMTCTQPVGTIASHQARRGVTNTRFAANDVKVAMRFTDVLPEDLEASESPQFAVYALELMDGSGRRLGTSNQVSVLLAPTLVVKGLHSELDARGVYLIWEDDSENPPASLHFDYRVYRREKGRSQKIEVPYLQAVVHMRDGNRWTAVDTNFEWEKAYSYWIRPITKVYAADGKQIGEVEGEESAPVTVTTHDVFPPAVPQGLLVLVSEDPRKKFVDLIWAPNQEKDLAGYNVYRSENAGPMKRINSVPIQMLSFQDASVVAGHTYLYSVSAVDMTGNESARSPAGTAVQP